MITLLALLALSTGDQDLGAPTFKPSPERPVGWRGDGSGRVYIRSAGHLYCIGQ